MKLNRSIEAWDRRDAGAMSQMSEAAIKYAFEDAKQDIKRMAAIQAQQVKILKSITSAIRDGLHIEYGSIIYHEAIDALAAAGA